MEQLPLPDSAAAPATVLPYATPYAAPEASGVWREGERVLAVKNAVLPHRCVKCNAAGDGRPRRKTYYWHHPAIYFTILAGILIYVIVALVVRESGTVTMSLCSRHRARRLYSIAGGSLLALVGLVVAFSAAGASREWSSILPAIGILMILAGLIAGIIGARTLYPKKIDRQYLWLAGADPGFLDSLPPVPPPAWSQQPRA